MKLKMFEIMNEETYQKAYKDVLDSYDNLSGANTTDLKTMEVAIVVAFKDK